MAIARTEREAVAAIAAASVDAQTGPRRKRDAPAAQNESDDSDESDEVEPFDPGDDSDLGLDEGDEDDEDIGLDTAVGFDDAAEDQDLDLDDLDDDEDDDETWDADADEASELPDSDLESEDEEGEYGWIDDDDSAQDDDAQDDDFDDEPEASGDDGGAEGLEDESEIDDLDLGNLPELDKDSEEEVGLPGLEGVDELAGYGLLDEPLLEVAPGQVWKMLRARATRITRISWPADVRNALVDGSFSERSLAAHNQTLFLAARGLYRLDAQAEAFERLPLPAAEAQQLVVAEHEGAVQLLVNASGQLFLSSNAGESFAAQPAPNVTHAGFTHSAAGMRLWWRSADGMIGSDGPIEPAHDSALLLDADGGRSVAWLSRFEQLRVTLSADGGRSFASWPVPTAIATQDLTRLRLETCGDAMLLSAADMLLVGEHSGELTSIAPNAHEPATLADEEGETFVYACLERLDRKGEWLLIRKSTRADHASPLVLTSLGRELGEPLALAVGYSEGGMLSVFVACQEGVLRIEASLDGEELA